MILIAKNIGPEQEPHLGIMNITVKRNGFERQRESFEAELALKNIADDYPGGLLFVLLTSKRWNRESKVFAEVDGKIVAAKQGNLLAMSFHPEFTEDPRVHAYFAEMVRESMAEKAV